MLPNALPTMIITYTGMGIYTERGKNLYTEQPVAAVLSGTCGLYYGGHL